MPAASSGSWSSEGTRGWAQPADAPDDGSGEDAGIGAGRVTGYQRYVGLGRSGVWLQQLPVVHTASVGSSPLHHYQSNK
jgi:hypothetical protein